MALTGSNPYLSGFLFRKARGGHLQIEHLEGLGADDAGKFRRVTADVLTGNTALLVGDVAERKIDPSSGDLVEDLAAVPHRLDPLPGCLLPEIHLDGAALSHGNSHGFGKRGIPRVPTPISTRSASRSPLLVCSFNRHSFPFSIARGFVSGRNSTWFFASSSTIIFVNSASHRTVGRGRMSMTFTSIPRLLSASHISMPI